MRREPIAVGSILRTAFRSSRQTVLFTKLLMRATRDNNTLHTESRAARLLETMMFAAAR